MSEKIERDDINAGGILRFTAIIVVVTLLALLSMKLMFDRLLARERALDPPPSPFAERNLPRVPPAPRLQTAPEDELRRMRAAEDELLHGYGWLDREAGRVRIPIERAMELMAEREAGGKPDAR